jgi:8-oxo-dGTP pyrophosphatase MutT (NUDIX family)
MHREHILKNLVAYKPSSPEEMRIVEKFTCFVKTTPDCFERTHAPGHVTGSAFVLSEDYSCVLLALHAKLQRWLQLGGHADGCPHVHEVAHREAVEESGLSSLVPYLSSAIPIDYDVHEIPANKKEGVHLHYDVRYVFHSKDSKFICSNESLELKWIPLDEIPNYCNEPSTLRVIKKIQVSLQSEGSIVGAPR